MKVGDVVTMREDTMLWRKGDQGRLVAPIDSAGWETDFRFPGQEVLGNGRWTTRPEDWAQQVFQLSQKLELEQELCRLSENLALEARARAAAAQMAHDRGELVDDACALLDEVMTNLREAHRQEASRIIKRAGW